MADLQDPRWMSVKAALFVLLGCLAGGLLIILADNWRVTLLLLIAIWSFARAYYFVFYVIEHYIDSNYRFAGLWDFLRYCRNGTGGTLRATNPDQCSEVDSQAKHGPKPPTAPADCKNSTD